MVPLVSLILYTFIFVIISTSTENRLSKVFKFYVIAMIIWNLGSFLMKTDIPPSSLFWNQYLTQTGIILVPVSLLHFSYVLIRRTSRSTTLRLAYFLSFLLLLLAWTGNIVDYAYMLDGEFYYELLRPQVYLLAAIASGISILALVTMIRAVNKEDVKLRKVQLVILALFLVIIGGALNINEDLGSIGIDIIFNSISAVLITYSIYRNKFLEINLVVKRGLYYSIYNFTLFAVYATMIIILYNVLREILEGSLFTILLVMSPMFLLLEPIRTVLQKISESIFYRAKSDQQIILNDFSSLVNTSFSLDKINSSLLAAIQDGAQSRHTSILLKNSNKYKLHETTIEGLNYKDTFILFNHPILEWFANDNDILLRNDIDNNILFKRLWDSEKIVINNMETEVMIPIYYLDEIIGIVVISERIDELPYSEPEIQFLQTLLNNAAAIIENAKTIDILKRQSITDELTKLYNHRHFHETVGNFIRNGVHSKFSIAIVDIDQFKIYNDLYGHSAGDNALVKIANILVESCPSEALLVRYGGEEFGIYFPEYGPIETKNIIEQIRQNVEESFLLSQDIREFLTVSVGASCSPNHGEQLEDLISKAFEAVLNSKQSGRNKSILYSATNQIEDRVHQSVQEKIKEAYISSTYALAATIDAKDHYTYGHSNNVAELSVAIAIELGFEGEDLQLIHNAGLLHDIGKVGIPESVLLKKGYLTTTEMDTMRSHVVQSINIIKHIPNLVDTIPIIISHHERFDGQGYPRGMTGDNIPVLGRVICIADAFDAMTTDRPYRKGLSIDQALFELKKHAGTQFDPKLVELLIKMVKRGDLEELNLENRPSY